MKLICTRCREFKKKKDTDIIIELQRIGLTSMHIPCKYRICCKCGTEIWDYKLENQNLKRYIKKYKWVQKHNKL